MIQTHQLQFSYPNSGSVFEFPDLKCGGGDCLLILGKSGVGKTTLLSLLGGVLMPTSGDVRLGDVLLSSLGRSELDQFRGKNIGLVFQQSHFINGLSVLDNLLLAQHLAGQKPNKLYLLDLLKRLNIDDKAPSKPSLLSQGEQQRLSIARALVNNPQLILADEPTSALDDEHCSEVITLLKHQAKKAGSALVVVTHDQRLKTEFDQQLIL